MKKLLVCLGVVAMVTGCGVSKEIVAQKDADFAKSQQTLAVCESVRNAYRAETAQLGAKLAGERSRAEAAEKDLAASRLRVSTAEAELATCGTSRDQTAAELLAARNELAAFAAAEAVARGEAERNRQEAEALKQRGDTLRSRLQKEIDNKSVEIESLRGKLSVRVLDEILFASGSARVLADGQAVLKKVAEVLADGDEMIRVEGHTDDVPIGVALQNKYASNWELSAARASSVVRYFESTPGIDPARLEAVGRAMYNPVAPNDGPENRQKNRRVEIVLAAPR